ncbi:MAG: PRC-barrel domain-containing protein [Rhodospirillaceae bacterium]
MKNVSLAVLLAGCLVALPGVAQDASQEVGIAPQTSPGALHNGATSETNRQADTILWHADDLIGKDIRSNNGEAVGSIKDIVINAPQGVIHVLIDVGGVLGVGDDRIAIGLHELVLTPDGTLIIDSTPEQVAARPQYRFPESPTTGAIRPGAETPQTAAGIGGPSQGPEYIPGTTPGPGGGSQVAEERAQIPGDRMRDTALGKVLRGGGVTGPTSTEADATFAQRDEYLTAANRRLQDFHQRIETRSLEDKTAQALADQYSEAAGRYEALQSASEEAWPTALKNFRMSLARLQDNWQQAEGVPSDGGSDRRQSD